MKSSKSLFTLTACALVAAAVPAFALNSATTEYNGTTYSGDIYKITSTGFGTLAASHNTLTPFATDDASKYVLNSDTQVWEWQSGFGGGASYGSSGWLANQSTNDNLGNTLLLNAATSAGNAYTYTFDYGHVWVGGLITEGEGSYTIGRAGNTNVHIAGANAVNMNIAANTTIQSTSTQDTYGTISVENSGTWNVSSGKTLTLTAGRGVSFADNASVSLSGEGSLNIGSGTALTLGSNSALTIGENSTLSGVTTVSGAGTLTVNGTLSLAGTLTNAATLAFGTGANLTLTGDLETYSDYNAGGYVDKDGTSADNGYISSYSVSVISNTGTLSGETDVTVTYSDSSGELSGTLDSSGKVSFGTDYRTYYVNTSGETAFDSSLFHDSTTTVSVASGATLKLENETTGTRRVSGAGTVEINVTGNEAWFDSTVLTGDVSVVKTGNAKATLYAAQSYTGGTTIESGNVGVGNDSSLGTGKVTFAGAGAQLTAQTGGLTLANAVEIGADGGTIHTQSNTMTLSGSVSAEGVLTKQGSGTLVLRNDSLTLGDVSVAGGSLQIRNESAGSGGNKTIGTVTLASGTSLQLYAGGYGTGSATTTVGGLVLGGDATLASGSGSSHGGSWTVNSLSLASGVDSATLTLKAEHQSSATAVFELGSADSTSNFAGTLKLSQTDTGNRRAAALVLSDGEIAKNAVIEIATPGSSSAYVLVGVNAADTKIAGLSGGTDKVSVFSGSVAPGTNQQDGTTIADIITPSASANTLTINASSDYAYAGTILGDVNLVKDGAGTQTLSGASTAFDGEVSILAGVLALGNAAAIGGTADAKTSVTIDGGQLSVAQNVELNATAITVVLSDAYSSSAAILGEGSLASGTTVTLDMELAGAVAALAAETTQTSYSYQLFGNTSLSQNLGEDAITLSSSLVDAGYEFSFDSATGIVTLSMIPEPSAFGLLAGLGAVALVASRRRRRAK